MLNDGVSKLGTCILLLLACMAGPCSSLVDEASGLAFKPDGSFKIIQFTDVHLGESKPRDAASIKVVQTVLLKETDVDLVVLSGDMVSGFANRYSRQGWFSKQYAPLLDVLATHQVPHAIVLGNHDDEGLLSRRDIVLLDQRSRRSLTKLGPAGVTGATNYWLDIAGRSTPAARLWFLDSMDRGCAGIPGWGCVAPDAVQWFKRTATSLPAVATSAAFVHIPVPEFIMAWNRAAVSGGKGEPVCCPSCNSLLFDALRHHGVTSIYSGHDHDNDFVAQWEGMRLAYGRKSGYGSYGPRGLHGARVIVLRENEPSNVSETYLRLEDGSAMSQARTSPPFWKRLQWSCEPGDSLRRMMSGAAKSRLYEGTHIKLGAFGACTATLEQAE